MNRKSSLPPKPEGSLPSPLHLLPTKNYPAQNVNNYQVGKALVQSNESPLIFFKQKKFLSIQLKGYILFSFVFLLFLFLIFLFSFLNFFRRYIPVMLVTMSGWARGVDVNLGGETASDSIPYFKSERCQPCFPPCMLPHPHHPLKSTHILLEQTLFRENNEEGRTRRQGTRDHLACVLKQCK